MTTTLLIVRHGQTAWNKEERFRGRTDLPLDETGRRQAEAAARRIAATYQPVAILASPLQRTMQTGAAIARPLGLDVTSADSLLDLDYGDFAGLSPAEAEACYPELYRSWVNAPHIVRFPQGESLDDVRQRVTDLVSRLKTVYANEQVVLVTHLVVCRILLCSLLGIHNGYFNHFRVEPASLTVFELDGGRAVLATANDTCHLKERENDV